MESDLNTNTNEFSLRNVLFRIFSLKFWIPALIGLLIFFIFASHASISEVKGMMEAAEFWYLVPALVLAFAGTSLRAIRFYLFVPSPGREIDLYAAFALIRSANYILPFRSGELVALYLLKRWRFAPTMGELSPTWILFRICDLSGLIILFAVAFAASQKLAQQYEASIEVLVAATGVGILLVGLFPFLARIAAERLEHLRGPGRLIGLLRSTALGLNRVQSYRETSLALIVAILISSANAAIMVCGLKLAGVAISWSEAAFISITVMAINLLPIRAPLGLGTGEAIWAGVLLLFGFGAGSAIAAAVGVRLVLMSVILVDGVIGYCIAMIRGQPLFGKGKV